MRTLTSAFGILALFGGADRWLCWGSDWGQSPVQRVKLCPVLRRRERVTGDRRVDANSQLLSTGQTDSGQPGPLGRSPLSGVRTVFCWTDHPQLASPAGAGPIAATSYVAERLTVGAPKDTIVDELDDPS